MLVFCWILTIIARKWIRLKSPIQTYTQCTTLHTGSSGLQPQHLVLNTICSSIQPIYSGRWAYRCRKHVELFMIINKIFASSWYLSSFSYMMHGHTYIKSSKVVVLHVWLLIFRFNSVSYNNFFKRTVVHKYLKTLINFFLPEADLHRKRNGPKQKIDRSMDGRRNPALVLAFQNEHVGTQTVFL